MYKISVQSFASTGVDLENSERGGRVPRPNENFTFQDIQHCGRIRDAK